MEVSTDRQVENSTRDMVRMQGSDLDGNINDNDKSGEHVVALFSSS